MQDAKKSVPEVDDTWQQQDKKIMSEVCRHKFKACVHARSALLESHSEIVEAMFDK